MKRILRAILSATLVLVLGFGVIAGLTQLSSGSESSTASQQDVESEPSDELAFSEYVSAEECLPSEQWDSDEEVCYYECDTDAECAEIEAQLDAELDDIYDNNANKDASQLDAVSDDIDVQVVSYTIEDSKLVSTTQGKEVSSADQEVWDLFLKIAPDSFIEKNIIRYETYDDAHSDATASVTPSEDNPSQWILRVNTASTHTAEAGFDLSETTYTLIHEFAHILTLRAEQVPPDVSTDGNVAEACQTFYTGEGCSSAAAYINEFYVRFWEDIFAKLPEEGADDSKFYEFYEEYQERFITDYAATNPGEDIAESFTAFILKPQPDDNSIADQKIRFFYEYEELKALRQQIRSRLR